MSNDVFSSGQIYSQGKEGINWPRRGGGNNIIFSYEMPKMQFVNMMN